MPASEIPPASPGDDYSPHAAANMLTKPPVYGILCYAFLNPLACFHQIGEVSEWFKEAVLKTVEQQCSVGSNPTFSANFGFSGCNYKVTCNATMELYSSGDEAPLLRE